MTMTSTTETPHGSTRGAIQRLRQHPDAVRRATGKPEAFVRQPSDLEARLERLTFEINAAWCDADIDARLWALTDGEHDQHTVNKELNKRSGHETPDFGTAVTDADRPFAGPDMPIPGPGVLRAELPTARIHGQHRVLPTPEIVVAILCLIAGLAFAVFRIDQHNAEMHDRILRLEVEVSRLQGRADHDATWRAAHP